MSKKSDKKAQAKGKSAKATSAASATSAAAASAAAEKEAKAETAPAMEETEPAEAAVPDEETGLQQQLETAQAEVAEHKDNYLRAVAELENMRRRTDKQISDTRQYVLSEFAKAIGEVRDCLEVALENIAPEQEKMHEGVALTLRKLVSAMDAQHILPIKPDIGAAFDPTIHMAIGQLPASATAPADSIAAVVQGGYMLNGRVLRAASVMVAVAAATEETPAADSIAADKK